MEDGVFYHSKLTQIFCEHTSQPSGWFTMGTGWHASNATVYWYRETEPIGEEGNFWHYDTDGVTPVIWE